MQQRYTCMICRNEIVRPGTECPYCKGRSVIAEGASPRMLAFVFCVMVGAFVLTSVYAGSFREEGRERGRIHFEAASMHMDAGRFDEAIERYRDALLYSRDDRESRLGLARALFAAGRSSESEVYLAELRAEDATSGIVNHLLARLAARDGRIDESISYYHSALHGAWSEHSERMRLQIGLEMVDLIENSDRTQRLLTAVLDLAEMRPDDPVVIHRLAALLLATEVYDRASGLYSLLLENDADDGKAHLGRAEAEFHLRNYLTAQRHYREAWRLGAEGATTDRIELCNRIIDLDPSWRGIRESQRINRSRELVARSRTALKSCIEARVGPPMPLEEDEVAAVAAADEMLRAGRLPDSAEATETNILLAQRVWTVAEMRCGAGGPSDEPLRHVIAKLSR